MDCHKSRPSIEEFRRAHFRAKEVLFDTSVKTAMESLQISAQSPSATVETQRLDRKLGEDSQTDQQNDKQTKEVAEETNLKTQSMVTAMSTSNVINNKEVTNQLNTIREESIEAMDGSSSDSIYDSSSETEYVNKNECCDQTCDVTKDISEDVAEDQKNNINSVVQTEPPLTTMCPLKYRWQLWFWKAEQGVKVVWEQALQRVCKPFDTVEDFWRLYHHIIPVQQLVPPSDYCVFKEGISPMWEDSHNIKGGKWTLDFAKGSNRSVNPHLDEIWLEVLLCLIGEGFNEFGEDICGAVVNIRSKKDRISVWTANSSKTVSNLKIGEILKIRSRYSGQIKFEAHITAQRIAEEKERQFDAKHVNISSKPKTSRRSCNF